MTVFIPADDVVFPDGADSADGADAADAADGAPPARRRRDRPRRHLADLTRDERRAAVRELGQPAFRADQLSRHYFDRLLTADDAAAMTDLPRDARAGLLAALMPALLTPARVFTCDGGDTVKTLWRAGDGVLIESVLMRYPDRTTVCVSSQAGCGMGCPFCATGQAGLTRNLSTAEIVEQVVAAARLAARPAGPGHHPGPAAATAAPSRLSNVVFMGMGEPLANYRAVVAALRRLSDPPPGGLGLSARSLTVSTVGLVPAIRRLAGEGLPVRLALSLHAPDDELRNTMVPVNRRWPVAEVLAAVRDYADTTGRRVTIEYALVDGVNDGPDRAELLAARLAGTGAHVNLIPLNPTRGSGWRASRPDRERAMVAALRAGGVTVTVRDTRGREIDAACGQLAALEAAAPGGGG
jgi:23S rRNA (adenine2503-C2)-methyltransferase